MLPFLPCLLGTPINLTGVIFTTGKSLSASIFSFVNKTTVRWSALYFTISGFYVKDTSVDEVYT